MNLNLNLFKLNIFSKTYTCVVCSVSLWSPILIAPEVPRSSELVQLPLVTFNSNLVNLAN